ncbi:MAG: phosphatase PAP2 family protein [Xenococcaceae cyanobacterium]
MILKKNLNQIQIFLTLFLLFPFINLCRQILNQNYPSLDYAFFLFLEEKADPSFKNFFVGIYYLSGVYITAIVVATALGILIRKRYWQEAMVLAFGALGILIIIDEILKPFFARRRPPSPRLVEVFGSKSFPSGHAAGGVFLYFYLSFIIAARYPKYAKYIYGLATIIIIGIGFSSIYVKAHWATDILAGYAVGYIWLLLCLALLKLSNPTK